MHPPSSAFPIWTRVSFDINYRAKLWRLEEARLGLEPLLAHVDLLFCPQADASAIFGISDLDPGLLRYQLPGQALAAGGGAPWAGATAGARRPALLPAGGCIRNLRHYRSGPGSPSISTTGPSSGGWRRRALGWSHCWRT